MRLNKFISHNTTYSRREADQAIFDGYVKVNGEIEQNPATDVDEKKDVVVISGQKVEVNKVFTVIVYNKPKGELVTKKDDRGRKVVYDTLDKKFKHFIPVGRLDYASEGVLLLTDSPKVATVLMESNAQRTYRVKIKGSVTESMLLAMEEGMELEDASAGAHEKSTIGAMHFAPFVGYEVVKNKADFSIIKVAISEGKNRELRRFFGYFNADVVDLKRLSFGAISLNNLPTGKSRYLTKQEYTGLRKFLKQAVDA